MSPPPETCWPVWINRLKRLLTLAQSGSHEMSEASAWLLELGKGLLAAVGEREMIHLLPDQPLLSQIPQSPVYCNRVFVWQGEIIPLMDLSLRLLARPAVPNALLAIVAFEKSPQAKALYGAILLNAPPRRIVVNDNQDCDLPDSPSGWRRLAISCFEQPRCGSVPVLDLAKVFSRPLKEDIETVCLENEKDGISN
jgi:hypothetical protein